MSELCENLYTVEIVEPLGIAARTRMRRLGHENVEVRIGDGYYGGAEHAPFDVGQAVATTNGYIAAVAATNGFAVATRDTAPFEAAGVAVVNPWLRS